MQQAPFAPLVRDAILNADYTKPSTLRVPYVGIQYIGIPESQTLGTQVRQEIGGALAGHMSVDQALLASQVEAETTTKGSAT